MNADFRSSAAPDAGALQRVLPYAVEQLFDLAADVERYPEFMPLWIHVRVLGRDPGILYTEQEVGLGPVRLEFASRVALRRPERIEVTSDDPRFREFRLAWTFGAGSGGGCLVRIAASIELRSHLLQRAAERALRMFGGRTMTAFEARARQVYGTATV